MKHDQLSPFVRDGWISAQRHPHLPLTIYNYTPKAQFERHWTPETLTARGLILDDDDVIVGRGFPKFFNLGEHDGPLPNEPHLVYEKIDGSLLLVTTYRGELVTATRGSFTSPQALVGRELFQQHHRPVRLVDGYTILFEVIYPENRIVVDYGDRRELVFLGTIENASGRTLPDRLVSFCRAEAVTVDFRNPPQIPNAEGYVVHFVGPSDLRIKVKFDEYVRLHRILTGVNARKIWEIRSTGGSMDELLTRVPDEFYEWVKRTNDDLTAQFDRIRTDALLAMHQCPRESRKESAAYISQQGALAPVMFAMLDEKDYGAIIWKQIKPKADRPFKVDEA